MVSPGRLSYIHAPSPLSLGTRLAELDLCTLRVVVFIEDSQIDPSSQAEDPVERPDYI